MARSPYHYCIASNEYTNRVSPFRRVDRRARHGRSAEPCRGRSGREQQREDHPRRLRRRAREAGAGHARRICGRSAPGGRLGRQSPGDEDAGGAGPQRGDRAPTGCRAATRARERAAACHGGGRGDREARRRSVRCEEVGLRGAREGDLPHRGSQVRCAGDGQGLADPVSRRPPRPRGRRGRSTRGPGEDTGGDRLRGGCKGDVRRPRGAGPTAASLDGCPRRRSIRTSRRPHSI